MDVLIDTPEVVNKSYPRFFDELSRIAREWA
jgi:5-enolpyruvylshikimate-3-phosphate synthase